MLTRMLYLLALSVAVIPMATVQANDQSVLVADFPRDTIARPGEERVLYFQSWRDNEAWSSRIMSSELLEGSSTGVYQRYRVQTRTIADAPSGASVETSTYEVRCTDGISGSVTNQNGYIVSVQGDIDFPSNAELGSYALHRMVCLGSAPDWAL